MNLTQEYFNSKELLLSELAKKTPCKKLQEAKLHQKFLTTLYSGEASEMEIWMTRWESLLAKEKYDVFKKMYSSYFAPVLNKIQTHYEKIFSATGGFEEMSFGNNEEAKIFFRDNIKPYVFEGECLLSFFKKNYIRLLLSEPSSLFLTYVKDNEKVEVKYLNFEKVKYIESYNNGDVKRLVYDYDKRKNLLLIVTEKEIVLYNTNPLRDNSGEDFIQQRFIHGQKRTPLTYVSSDFDAHNPMLRKSPLSDSLVDIENYNVFSTFSVYYKSYSAFGKEYIAETLSEVETPEHSVNGYEENSYRIIPRNAKKNQGLFGEITEMPMSMLTEEGRLDNIKNMYFRIDGSTDLLTFQQEDLKALEGKILSDCLGHNFSKSANGAAKTATQVFAEMDTQEANLHRVKAKAENTLNSIYKFSAIFAELIFTDVGLSEEGFIFFEEIDKLKAYHDEVLSFESFSINLGDRFFFKSEENLLNELEKLTTLTSNEHLIHEKTKEFLTANGEIQDIELRRFNIISMLQPFSARNVDWVTQNRDKLDSFDIFVYENFKRLLFLFEEKNGAVENYASETTNPLERVSEEFITFARTQYQTFLLNSQPKHENSNDGENNRQSRYEGGSDAQNEDRDAKM